LFSKLVNVRGEVRPVVNNNLHLSARLDNGRSVVGQHLLTGKESEPLDSPIRELSLVKSLADPRPATARLPKKRVDLIRKAELICFPMGSFFTSLMANLLPEGVGRAVADNPCPKIFIPNTGVDPECLGHSVHDQIDLLTARLTADDPGRITPRDVLTHVLMDSANKRYPGLKPSKIAKRGFIPVQSRLVSRNSDPLLDPRRTAHALMSLA
ncbi:MAG: 2-phospho-L-lactate transferase CofD family protein, partial [Desulfovibrionaceae bacterium]